MTMVMSQPVRRTKIGRNEPCPCGSGKKYKRCCYGKPMDEPKGVTEKLEGEDDDLEEEVEAEDILKDLKDMMREKEFGSLKEMQAFVDWRVGRRNRMPLDDFKGLSPEQMHRLLDFPFSSPDLVTFSRLVTTTPDARVTKLLASILAEIGEKGLKITTTGNLPLKVVSKAAEAFLSEDEKFYRGSIRSETEFPDLHVTRIVAGLAGLTRKYHGRIFMTKSCRKLMSEGGMNLLYPRLFRTFVEKYNWAFRDRCSDFRIIQQSFLFTLWLFHRFGNEWRDPSFYSDCFLAAFPMVLSKLNWKLAIGRHLRRWCAPAMSGGACRILQSSSAWPTSSGRTARSLIAVSN